MTDERPLETGWLPDTPIDDTLLRRFLFNQADVNAAMTAGEERAGLTEDVALADSHTPVFFFNQAILLRPLTGLDDPVFDAIAAFFSGGDRGYSMLSLWPTPDLGARGWTLLGHPAFVVRAPGPYEFAPPNDVEVRTVTTEDDLAALERIFIDGYPMPMAADLPRGAFMRPELLNGGITMRIGLLDGKPVAAGMSYVAHGLVNLCGGATMPDARRRGVWESLVWARVDDASECPAVAYTSDYSRPGFIRMGFLPILRFTLWGRNL